MKILLLPFSPDLSVLGEYNSCMSPFYTRSGDDGYTGLLGEGRVPKYHPQTEAVGTIDEANSFLGMARAISKSKNTVDLILLVQRDLYNIMAEVSARPENAARFRKIDENRLSWLEEQTNAISQLVNVPNEFIVPGDSTTGAVLDIARTVIRRAERRVAELLHQGVIENVYLLRYLNRLSSLCFALELLENQSSGKDTTLAKGENN